METEVGEPRVFVLDPEADVLAAAPIYRVLADPAERLRALAGALASSPAFRGMNDAVLVVRTEEPARLALLGRFTPAEAARVEALPGILSKGLRRLRYVSYADAEHAARQLAGRLSATLGAETLSLSRFVALPRGGLFVLGMLSYMLDLRAEQVGELPPSAAEDASPDAPLVIVDDCALSGLRFAEALERAEAPAVAFAHLFSHPRLRDEIERRESRVVACLSGGDLRDTAGELLDEDRDEWESRWRDRSDPRVYWIGLPEHVCFPWNEPDIAIWNAESGAEEAPWRLVPPEYCLKNRPVEGATCRVQEQRGHRGPFRPGDATVYASFGDAVLVADVDSGRAFSFTGIAGDVWLKLAAGGSLERVSEALAEDCDAEPARLQADVESTVERALGLGVLKRVNDA